MTVKKAVRYASYIPSIIKTVQQVKGLVNSEMKHFDATFTINPTTAGVVTQLTSIVQGDGVSNRDGESVLLQSLYFRGTTTQNVSDTSVYNQVRFILFQCKNEQDAPTIAKLLTSASYISPLNLDNSFNYRIMWDKTMSIIPQYSGHHNQKFFKKYFKLNTHVKYDGTTGASVKGGGIYLATISDVASNGPDTSISYRLRFTDN